MTMHIGTLTPCLWAGLMSKQKSMSEQNKIPRKKFKKFSFKITPRDVPTYFRKEGILQRPTPWISKDIFYF